MRILLLEDDPDIGEGIHLGLKKHGIQADWLQSGRLGLNALSSAPTMPPYLIWGCLKSTACACWHIGASKATTRRC